MKKLMIAIVSLFAGLLAAVPLSDGLCFTGVLAGCNPGDTINFTLASGA